LDDEMTSPSHETVVITPLISKILYRHLHTHCTLIVQALGTHQGISMRTLVPIPAPSPPFRKIILPWFTSPVTTITQEKQRSSPQSQPTSRLFACSPLLLE
jgi:hypothetical protein